MLVNEYRYGLLLFRKDGSALGSASVDGRLGAGRRMDAVPPCPARRSAAVRGGNRVHRAALGQVGGRAVRDGASAVAYASGGRR